MILFSKASASARNRSEKKGLIVEYTRVARLIQEFEEKHDILQYKIDEWSIWPLFRLSVGYDLSGAEMAVKERMRVREILSTIARDLPTLFNPPRAALLVLTLNSARSEYVAGKYKDVFFDDLLAGRTDFLKIEDIENCSFLTQRRHALILSRMSILGFRVLSRLLQRTGCVTTSLRVMASSLSKLIREELKLQHYTPQFVCHRLAQFYWGKRLYRQFLQRVRPHQLIHIGCHFYEILAAAKELGIRTVEFQHGFVDCYSHFGYAWERYACRYKQNLPIPDCLFLYGEHWRQAIAANGFWDQELYVVGSLRMDEYRKKRKANPKSQSFVKILWTSDGIEISAAVDFVKRALSELNPLDPIALTVKLHPHSENRKDPYLAAFGSDPRVRVLLGSESPSTFELLTQANLHVSIASTCHYEAIALGVPTVIIPLRSHEKILDLVSRGHAQLAATPTELADAIRNFRNLKVKSEVSELYFKSNALLNMKSALGLI